MRDLQDDWLFYDANVLPIIRSLLEVFPEVREVALDIGALVGGGYLDADEKLCDARRTPDLPDSWPEGRLRMQLKRQLWTHLLIAKKEGPGYIIVVLMVRGRTLHGPIVV